jgi:hypothetical protein
MSTTTDCRRDNGSQLRVPISLRGHDKFPFQLSNSGEGCAFAFPRRGWRSGFASFPALEEMRAQGIPGARCTRGLVCSLRIKTRTRAYRYRRSIPAFPAQWLYGLLRALPGERLFCHRRLREASLLSDLMPAPRHQDHTTSPYAQAAHVSRSSRVHRIPPRVRDVRERPSHRVRRAELWG